MEFDKEEFYRKIKSCLIEIGIIIESDLYGRYIDEDILDSLTYIAFIVEIEEKFNVCIPDEYLQINMLETYDDIMDMLENIC